MPMTVPVAVPTVWAPLWSPEQRPARLLCQGSSGRPHGLAGARLGDDAAAAVAAAEAGAVAAGAAGTAAAVVSDVIAAPNWRQVRICQSCWALPTAVGVAGWLPGLLALDGGGPLGPLGPWGLLGGFQGAGPQRHRLRL